MMDRPSIIDTAMEVAVSLARRATCRYFRVGCVIVSPNKKLIGLGYNGGHGGSPHCEDHGCLRENNCACQSLHAEQNAVIHCHGVDTKDCIAVVTTQPCVKCTSLLIGAGISEIVALEPYRPISLPWQDPRDESAQSAQMLQDNDVNFQWFEAENPETEAIVQQQLINIKRALARFSTESGTS